MSLTCGLTAAEATRGKEQGKDGSVSVISASLSISIASEGLMVRACRLAHLSVCLSVCVCPESVLWQNG